MSARGFSNVPWCRRDLCVEVGVGISGYSDAIPALKVFGEAVWSPWVLFLNLQKEAENFFFSPPLSTLRILEAFQMCHHPD